MEGGRGDRGPPGLVTKKRKGWGTLVLGRSEGPSFFRTPGPEADGSC